MLTEQFRHVSQVMLDYYREATLQPTLEDFELWIEALKKPMKSSFRKMGFEKSKGALPFRRFYLEYHDDGMREYMKEKLSTEDFEYYLSLGKEDETE